MSAIPPPPPPSNTRILKKPAPLSDAVFTALSLFFLFSNSPKTISLSFPPNDVKLSFPIRKIPKMSSTDSRKSQRLAPVFATPQSLSDWLKPRMSADLFGAWGVTPGTKNVHNLWLEIAEGETWLADSSPPIRTVEVAIVRIIQDNKILIESHQELSDGVVKDRNRPLSEKMKPCETIEAAVFRALREELGSVLQTGFPDNVNIIPGSYVKKLEERLSSSYPGLPVRYVLHTVDAEVHGLPEDDFCTEEASEYGLSDQKNWESIAVSCKKHYWRWIHSDSLGVFKT